MMEDTAILIYQSLNSPEVNTFEHPIIQWHSEKYPQVPLFHIDSFSDSSQFQYASQLLEQDIRTLMVILMEDQGETKGLIPLLNKVIRNNLSIVVKGDHPLLTKMMKTIEVDFVANDKALIRVMTEWIKGS